MASTSINLLIKSLKETLSNSDKALNDSEGLVDDIMRQLERVSNLSYSFITLYDLHEYETAQDASLIKEKMKETIIKVANDEIQ